MTGKSGSSGGQPATSPAREETIARLQRAIEEYSAAGAGEGLFDEAAEQAKAPVRERALGLLDHRARSRAELRRRLLAADFAAPVVEEVIADLASLGLLDDASFAHEWVRQRAARRGKSRRALDHELREKGVAAAERAEALAQIDDGDEAATARAVAAKKARSVRAIPADYPQRQKELRRIVGALARRGFPESMSLGIAREALEDRIAELTELTELAELGE